MEEWIMGLVDDATRSIREYARSTASRIRSLWSVLTSFFARVHRSWEVYRERGRAWLDQQIAHAQALVVFLKWLVRVEIPRLLHSLTVSIQHWTSRLINDAISALGAVVGALEKWARRAFDTLRATVDKFSDWVHSQINALVSDIRRLIRHVFTYLASPEKLAIWAGAAIIAWTLDYLSEMAVPIGRALWNSRATVALEYAEKTEDTIARIIG
jgi:hypothetical protein